MVLFCRYIVQRRAQHFFLLSVHFTGQARFGRDGIINIHDQHQWTEDNVHCVIHSRHQQQFSINVCAGIVFVTVRQTRMSRLTGLQATTTEISCYMICQSYWKLYHWQAEHECGTRVLVLRAVQDVLSNMYPTAWPPRSPDLNLVDIYLWRQLNTLVYATSVERHFNIALWMPVRLPATAPASLHGCGGP
jgi:hypothetical protein